MWWVIFKYVKVAIVSSVVAIIISVNVGAWSGSSTPEFIDSDIKVFYSHPCQGNFGTITLNGKQIAGACIMGENLKVAWYLPQQGGVAYAISFPLGNTYYNLDVCEGMIGCVFAEHTNTFVGFSGVYRNFVSNLEAIYRNGELHYVPRENSSEFSVGQFADKTFTPQTIAISRNGKWALLEVRDYGTFRIDTRTLEVRRIIAPGISYGYGSDPEIQMAISNDGKTVAVVGTRMGLSIILVDETCGDTPNPLMKTYYTGNAVQCLYLPTPTNKYIADFRHAVRPVFSNNDKTLSFDALSYSVAGRHFTLFSDNNANLIQPTYLALGDSFTSGEGETDDLYYLGGASNKCHVSNRSYAFLLGASWDTTPQSIACSGATMQSARGKSAKVHQPNQLAELESKPIQVATLGIGGNDAGLIGKLKDCIGIDTCKWAGTPEHRSRTAEEIKQLFPHLKNFYADMKVRTLGPVIVVGYPRIITALETCSSAIGLLLNQTERVFMNEAIHYLNQVIQAAANDVGVEYADVEEALSGGELCTTMDSPFMNAIRIGDDYPDIAALPFLKVIGAESFHPKPAAHAKLAAKIFQSFPDLSNIPTYMNNGNPTDVPEVGSYWDSIPTSLPAQKAVSFLNKSSINKKDLVELFFPAFTFKPLSSVALEIHSEVKGLGVVKSSEDGSLTATISSSNFDIGFHSVHAIGEDFAGNAIDTYDFLAVMEENNATEPALSAQSEVKNLSDNPQDDALLKAENTNTAKPEAPKQPLNGFFTGDVLGAATVRPSQSLPIGSMKQNLERSTSTKKDKFNWAIVLALSVGLLIIAAWFSANKQQKRPGNPT